MAAIAPQRLKPFLKLTCIAALKRCATQNHLVLVVTESAAPTKIRGLSLFRKPCRGFQHLHSAIGGIIARNVGLQIPLP